MLLLMAFLKKRGDGRTDASVHGADAQELSYQGIRTVPYFSIFGKLTIERAYYWVKGAQEGICPLDALLNLPKRCYSYLLEEWTGPMEVEKAFDKTVGVIKRIFGLTLSKSSLEELVREAAEDVQPYYGQKQAPDPSTEGEIMVVTADGKHPRSVDDIVGDLRKPTTASPAPQSTPAKKRPRPKHKRERATLKQWVTERLRMLLTGKLNDLLREFKQSVSDRKLSKSKRKTLSGVIRYYSRNRTRMKYDPYLAMGLPIGSGVIEGACRNLVKDRMELTGMRWVQEGADAMLELRATEINGDWNDFMRFRVQREHDRLYGDWALAG